MKFNFKKIASVFASAALVGSTMGFAVAANYPAPFVSGSSQDVAIVVGSSAAQSDWAAATDIGANLASELPSIGLPTGGDYVAIERAATKFGLGKGILDVISGTLTNSELSTVLADGTYTDANNDEFKYTQKISLNNHTLDLFDDNDYKEDTPTVGIAISSGTPVLNYTLDFSTEPQWEDLANTDIELMGKSYFISSVTTNTTINLLDSANTALITEGETKTISAGGKTYTVTLNPEYLSGSASSPQTKLEIDGSVTNSLSEGNTYKLSDGSYVGIKDIAMRDVAGTSASVEFSIGSGKIEITDGTSVKMNEVTVNGLTAHLVNTNGTSPQKLSKIMLEWEANDDAFATTDSEVVMPGFETIKLSFAGMEYPTEEQFTVEKGSSTYVRLKNFPLKDGVADIDLLYGNGTNYYGVGKEETKKLVTGVSATIDFDKDTDAYFVASYDDGTNSESYLVRATSFVTVDSRNKTTIQYWSDGGFVDKKTEAIEGDSVVLGSVSLTIGTVDKDAKWVNITGGSNVHFDRLFSDAGLKVFLPIANTSSTNYSIDQPEWPQVACNTTAYGWSDTSQTPSSTSAIPIVFVEETKNSATEGGISFNATAGWASAKASITGMVGESPDGGYEIGDSDVMRAFIYGDLATELLYDTSGDQDSLTVIYHGAESYGKAYISEVGASSGSTVNIVPIDDTEAATVTNNLIVVGGTCVNSVAAELLGVPMGTCSEDWTAATGVSSGEYLIQTFARSGKVATLVAGYEAGDTTNAAQALRTLGIDVSVGKKYKGSTASDAALV